MTLSILLIEPYYGGSHQVWADGYQTHSRHNIELLTLPAQFWKWRMQGGAVTLASQFQKLTRRFDLILASDMFDLSIFRTLTRDQTNVIPIALYFHENQLTYPQNTRQNHGWQYGFINYASALSADAIFFNSQYHLESFFDELPRMLKHFADFNELQTVETLRARSSVLFVGLDLQRFDTFRPARKHHLSPLILWNHRWEEDKNPQLFVDALLALAERGYDFRAAIAGENFQQIPAEFEKLQQKLGERIVQFGYIDSFETYARLLWQADYVVSTAYQEFFGLSAVEAIYCGCIPILPRRLNYPHLIPEPYHSRCLYPGNKLTSFLAGHLDGEHKVDRIALQETIAQFDWTIVAKQYDDALEMLVHTG